MITLINESTLSKCVVVVGQLKCESKLATSLKFNS